jgi:hypothetical protein
LILFVNAALFLSAQQVKKERYPLEVKAQEAKNETKKYFNKFFDSYYCFIFILKYILPKEIAAPLIKFFNFAAPQNYKNKIGLNIIQNLCLLCKIEVLFLLSKVPAMILQPPFYITTKSCLMLWQIKKFIPNMAALFQN